MSDSTEGRASLQADTMWRTSTFSVNGECVSVAHASRQVLVRNSNHPEAGTLCLRPRALAHWIAGVKAGEFDHLGA